MKNKKDYLLVLILLFFSGNPLISIFLGKFSPVFGLVLIFLIIHKNIRLDKQFFSLFKFIAIGIFLIAIFQSMELDIVSWLGMSNLLVKFFLGGAVINHLKEKFNWIFFKVVIDLSKLSLAFFVMINILNFSLPYISLNSDLKSYLIYNLHSGHMLQNAGMFWEPGAYAGIITLCLVLNYNNLKYYWIKYRYGLIAIILALVTSQSSTGFIVGFVIILFLFINKKNIIILPLFVSLAVYLYQTTDFLGQKIESQFEQSKNQKIGEVSNSRFGSAIFDWYYIQKHPLIGNGLDEATRYADHKYLFVGEQGDVIGSGNGFTGTLASLGSLYLLGYLYLLWKATAKQNKIFASLILLVVTLNLQGEQWLNYPLYLGLPFLIFKPIQRQILLKKNRRIINYNM